jgi:hypothetical protein
MIQDSGFWIQDSGFGIQPSRSPDSDSRSRFLREANLSVGWRV